MDPTFKCFEEKKGAAKLMWEAPFCQTAVFLRAYGFAFDWSKSQNTASAKIKYVSSQLD